MSIYEFCFLAIEECEEVSIWSIEEESEVFRGTYQDARNCIYDCEDVQSFGIENGIICINIE